jgi:hypothetical protein
MLAETRSRAMKATIGVDLIRTKEQIELRIKRLLDEKRRLEAQLRDVEAQLRVERVRLKQE